MNLEKQGYKMWSEDEKSYGTTRRYQKRMDTTKDFFDYPLCECNDKVFINIEHFKCSYEQFGGILAEADSYEINLVHENADGYWCDLKIYSLKAGDLEKNLSKFETKLLEMWKVFCNADQNLLE